MPTHSSALTKSTPKDFFLHLLAIFTLYVSVVSIMTLLFQYVNELYPDVLSYYREDVLGSIRMSTASIVIMFPVYLFVSWLIQKDVYADPAKAELKVRKWLVHFTLFIAAITIIIDLVTLVYEFLGGELTLRFILKVLIVLITTSVAFGYYFWDLRRKDYTFTVGQKTIVSIVAVFVICTIAAGFFIVGLPLRQRNVRLDERRVSDLQSLSQQILLYWQYKRTLPKTVSELQNDMMGNSLPTDPENGLPYEYSVKGALQYELCAVFAEDNISTVKRLQKIQTYADGTDQIWAHGAGNVCFTRTIDPLLLPPVDKAVPVVPLK